MNATNLLLGWRRNSPAAVRPPQPFLVSPRLASPPVMRACASYVVVTDEQIVVLRM